MLIELLMGLAAFSLALFGSELIGYLIHRLAHTSGTTLYETHMQHHLEAYPPKDFMSETRYRSTGRASFTFWFVPLFILFVGSQLLLLPLWLFWFSLAATVFSAIANIYLHDAVHVDRMTLDCGWFKKVRLMHFVHHRNMRKNYGIWQFWFDGWFGTKKEPIIRQKQG